MFGPGVWWAGLAWDRFGSSVQHCVMNSNGVSPFQGLQAFGIIVGIEKSLQVQPEPIVAVIVIPFDGRFF